MTNYRLKKKENSKRNIVIISVLIILIVVFSLFMLDKKGTIGLFSRNTDVHQESSDTIDYSPPTDEEKRAGDEQKEKIITEKQNSGDHQGGDTAQIASVIITDASQYEDVIEVRAFIPDHYQDGTCTITLSMGSNRVSKTTTAYRDVSTTICTNPLFSRSEFPSPGEWQVRVTYEATDAYAQSATKSITIN